MPYEHGVQLDAHSGSWRVQRSEGAQDVRNKSIAPPQEDAEEVWPCLVSLHQPHTDVKQAEGEAAQCSRLVALDVDGGKINGGKAVRVEYLLKWEAGGA